jgi:formylglycine-generating enzyme
MIYAVVSWIVVVASLVASNVSRPHHTGNWGPLSIEMQWVRIPAGVFEMGCVPMDKDCDANEQPRHRVVLTRDMWVMATPVTVAEFRRLAGAAGLLLQAQPEWSGASHPVVNVAWDEASAFCRSAGGRLPTEAEWEYAARGGVQGTLYPWGDDFSHGRVNVQGYAEDGPQTVPVGKGKPNGFGLHDLVGNVWQWVADAYDESYYGRSPQTDPEGPDSGRFRVARGASWKPYPKLLRISNRGRYLPATRNYYTGFRCLRDRGSAL